jgi:hypothetical protein
LTSKLKYRRGLLDLASLTQADASWHLRVECLVVGLKVGKFGLRISRML